MAYIITYTSYKTYTDREAYASLEDAAARVAQLVNCKHVSNVSLSTKQFPLSLGKG